MQLCASRSLRAGGATTRSGGARPTPRRCLLGAARPWTLPRAAGEESHVGAESEAMAASTPQGKPEPDESTKRAAEAYNEQKRSGGAQGGSEEGTHSARLGPDRDREAANRAEQRRRLEQGEHKDSCPPGYHGDIRQGSGWPDKSAKGA